MKRTRHFASITQKTPADAFTDVHTHFEGAIPADFFMKEFSAHPQYPHPDRLRLPVYNDMTDFARCWCGRMVYLSTPDAIRRAARMLAADLERNHVAAVIMHFSPDEYFRHDLTAGTVAGAIQDGFRMSNVVCRLIIDCVRDNGPDHTGRMVEEALLLRNAGVIGIGLGGDESAHPAGEFRQSFRKAKSGGLLTTAHCGELSVESVVDAAEQLDIRRVVHGYRAADDPAVIRMLAEKGIAVEVCLSSYACMYGGRPMSTHPLMKLITGGVDIIIGTDDADMFTTTIAREYTLLGDLVGNDDRIVESIRNASDRCRMYSGRVHINATFLTSG